MKPSSGLAHIKADVKQIYRRALLGFYVRLSFRGGISISEEAKGDLKGSLSLFHNRLNTSE